MPLIKVRGRCTRSRSLSSVTERSSLAAFTQTAMASIKTEEVEVGAALEKRKPAAVNRVLYSSRLRCLPPSNTSIVRSITGAMPGVPMSSITISTTTMRPPGLMARLQLCRIEIHASSPSRAGPTSKDRGQREAQRSTTQAEALSKAIEDPDEEVRNNAVRALAVLSAAIANDHLRINVKLPPGLRRIGRSPILNRRPCWSGSNPTKSRFENEHRV